MLSFELCKELKDAGFFQKEGDYFYYVQEYSDELDPNTDETTYTKEDVELIYVDCDHEEYGGKHEVLCYCPTLSELIDACGDGFESLHIYRDLIGYEDDLVWRTNMHELSSGDSFGSTPEEAVARLWLTLNHLNG